jgi:hypothetical protein
MGENVKQSTAVCLKVCFRFSLEGPEEIRGKLLLVAIVALDANFGTLGSAFCLYSYSKPILTYYFT